MRHRLEDRAVIELVLAATRHMTKIALTPTGSQICSGFDDFIPSAIINYETECVFEVNILAVFCASHLQLLAAYEQA